VLGVALGLCASICWGVSDFLGGLQSRHHHQLGVMLSAAIIGTALVAVVVAISGAPVPAGKYLLDGAAGGVLVTIALLAFYRALAIGVMSVVAPIAASGAVIPVLVGLASGERPGPVRLVGAAVAILGVVLVSRKGGGEARASLPALSILLAVIAGIGFGGQFVALHAAAKGSALWGALAGVATYLAAVSLAAGVAMVRGHRLRPDLRAAPGLVALGLAWGGANAFYATATRHGQLSAVAVAASLYPAITVVMARAVLHERVRRIQELGMVAAVVGIVLIGAG
jgi:drug/metabolite transporter (DMT)-like permease